MCLASSTSLVRSPPSKPIVKVWTGVRACSLMMANSMPESIPELRKSPTGTSLRNCSRTASCSSSWYSASTSSSVEGCRMRGTELQYRSIRIPARVTVIECPGGSFEMPPNSVFGEGTYRNVNRSPSASMSTVRGHAGCSSNAFTSDENSSRLPTVA